MLMSAITRSRPELWLLFTVPPPSPTGGGFRISELQPQYLLSLKDN